MFGFYEDLDSNDNDNISKDDHLQRSSEEEFLFYSDEPRNAAA